jgi:hypothetical protein
VRHKADLNIAILAIYNSFGAVPSALICSSTLIPALRPGLATAGPSDLTRSFATASAGCPNGLTTAFVFFKPGSHFRVECLQIGIF